MVIVAIVLQVLLALGFLLAGSGKVTSAKQSLQQRDHLHVAPWFWRLTGVLELLGAVGLVVGIFAHPVAIIAGILLAIIMIGASGTHIMRRDSFSHLAPALILLVLAVAVAVLQWASLGGKPA
jgi:uncharacterized membrane protein YphA (DoxX/SURF4 family)